MIGDHLRSARILRGTSAALRQQDGTVRWNTAVILALEVASGRSGAGEPVARWSQNSRESGFFSLCSVPGEKATSE